LPLINFFRRISRYAPRGSGRALAAINMSTLNPASISENPPNACGPLRRHNIEMISSQRSLPPPRPTADLIGTKKAALYAEQIHSRRPGHAQCATLPT
jgi:hypothetical protein